MSESAKVSAEADQADVWPGAGDIVEIRGNYGNTHLMRIHGPICWVRRFDESGVTRLALTEDEVVFKNFELWLEWVEGGFGEASEESKYLDSEAYASKSWDERKVIYTYEDGRPLPRPQLDDYPDTFEGLRAYHDAKSVFDSEKWRLTDIGCRQGWDAAMNEGGNRETRRRVEARQ